MRPLFPLRVSTGKRRSDKNALAAKFQIQRDYGFPWIELLLELLANVVREVTSDRNCPYIELLSFAKLWNARRRESVGKRQRKPLHGRCCAAKDAKDGILFVQDTAHRWR